MDSSSGMGYGGDHGHAVMQPRDYQHEMFEESMKQNIIVAMDTGSGKTAIAILRIREELSKDRDSKTVWFLCPTVALAEQQSEVVKKHIPHCRTRLLCGRDGVDTWETKRVWDSVLHNVQIVVCTHKVLQNALMHGSVWLSRISLLVFDEAHHCIGDHPANSIMRDFYHAQLRRGAADVPHVLGLTASPINKSAETSLAKIEANLNAVSKSPRVHRSSLMQYVHRPDIKIVTYVENSMPQTVTVDRLDKIVCTMDIDQDPQILFLERQGDLELKEKTRLNRKTYCQKLMDRLLRIALEIHQELGPSVARYYVQLCVKTYLQTNDGSTRGMQDAKDENRAYLTKSLSTLEPDGAVTTPDSSGFSPKLRALIEFLLTEPRTDLRAIVFTNTRASVVLIAECLSRHPDLEQSVRIGTFVGSSAHLKRPSDLTDISDIRAQESTMEDLRTGKINLVIATTVLEEGIDISACNLVVCFDRPKNMKSFLQRRGRARTEKSKFVLMTTTSDDKSLQEWQALEQKMIEMYQDEMRQIDKLKALEQVDEHDNRVLRVESTGAEVSLKESIPHIYHFCGKATKAQFANAVPIFRYSGDTDSGFSCRLTLPSCIDASLRQFDSVKTWKSEKGARREAAFTAYHALYDAGLLNEHLLPAPKLDPELAKVCEEVIKRPPLAEVQPQFDPWPVMAMEWQTCSTVYVYLLRLAEPTGDSRSVRMLAPCRLPAIEPFTLYISRTLTWNVKVVETTETLEANGPVVARANQCMTAILETIFAKIQPRDPPTFPLIFAPADESGDYATWISRCSTLIHCSSLPSSGTESALIIDERGKRWQPAPISPSPVSDPQSPLLCCVPFPKRRDFLHPVPPSSHSSTASTKQISHVFLDPSTCLASPLPALYVNLARSLPSIMHQIGTSLTVSALQQQIFIPASLSFSSTSTLTTALSTGLAHEPSDYQRLEFLGDALLKTHAAATLIAAHPTWPEGYLSSMKDRIVSNGRLALVAQDLGLDRFILTNPLRARRWRPKSNAALLSEQDEREKRSMSTKTLADIVEALVGAAYQNDGSSGEAGRVLSTLQLFLPELQWLSLESAASTLHAAAAADAGIPAASHDSSSTSLTREIESLLGYTFTHRALLTEALTHGSHMSPSAARHRSYERLEFLGDALLDYIVTTKIWAHHISVSTSNTASQAGSLDAGLSVDDMHQLRINTVNASFLAFCAFSATTTVATNPLPSPPTAAPQASPLAPAPTAIPSAIPLPAYLRFSPSTPIAARLAATQSRFAALQPDIDAALRRTEPHTYPWRLLAALGPDKIFSDIVEALLAAVFVDTAGDLRQCEAFLGRLGVLSWLERVLRAGGRVGRHPKERLGVFAKGRRLRYVLFCRGRRVALAEGEEDVAEEGERVEAGAERVVQEHGSERDDEKEEEGTAQDRGVDYPMPDVSADESEAEGDKGEWRCVVLVGGEQLASVHGSNRMEVEIAAAERAVEILLEREDAERGLRDGHDMSEGGVQLQDDADEAEDEAGDEENKA